MKIKETAKRIWDFIWKDDSIWSWLVALILVFVIVKFIFFPLLSLILATKLPLVVVESSSMSHPGSFIGNAIGLQDSFLIWWNQAGSWYENKGVSKDDAEKWSLRTGLEKGDIVLVYGRNKLEIGDIIIFEADAKYPLIHRIINISKVNGQTIYSTKGDNNFEQLDFEKQITEDALIGKAVFRIPKLGWAKLGFVEILKLVS